MDGYCGNDSMDGEITTQISSQVIADTAIIPNRRLVYNWFTHRTTSKFSNSAAKRISLSELYIIPMILLHI